MTRLPLKTDGDLHPDTRALFEQMQARGSQIPDLYRLLANAPDLLKAWTDLAWPLRSSNHVPRGLRELVIMRTAILVQAEYEWAHHWPLAIAAGTTEAQLNALHDWRGSDQFDAATRAALVITDELVGTGYVSQEAFEALRHQFDAAGLVHIVLTASFYVCVARFAHAFSLDLEPSYGNMPALPRNNASAR
jgi:4-carboxymuconolactone decarboxylase